MRKIFEKGERYTSNYGTEIELLQRVDKCRWMCLIVGTGLTCVINQSQTRSGTGFVTPVCKTVYGVGYYGKGNFVCRDTHGVVTDEYSAWANILKRCYTDYKGNDAPESYRGVEVCSEWHNYQTFAEWYTCGTGKFIEHNIVPKIDKDLKSKGMKLYSPSTCCFLPNIINSAIISNKVNAKLHNGVYKRNRKFYANVMHKYQRITCGTYDTFDDAVRAYKSKKVEVVRELANDYRHVLDDDVYKLLCDWCPS